jgi:hypothetical protein
MLDLIDASGFMDKLPQIVQGSEVTKYVSALQEFIGEARQLSAITTDKEIIAGDKQLKIAYDWMNESLPQAIAYANENTPTVAFQIDIVLPQLSELIQRLELGVPPNEVGDPNAPQVVNYRASLLAAWMFKLQGIDPKTGSPLTGKEIDRLLQKTLSAIEYVILQEAYVRSTATKSTGEYL